jgi:hypothetical protein
MECWGKQMDGRSHYSKTPTVHFVFAASSEEVGMTGSVRWPGAAFKPFVL